MSDPERMRKSGAYTWTGSHEGQPLRPEQYKNLCYSATVCDSPQGSPSTWSEQSECGTLYNGPSPPVPPAPSEGGGKNSEKNDGHANVTTSILFFLFFLGGLIGWLMRDTTYAFTNDILHPEVRESIRAHWGRERQAHQLQVERMQVITADWAQEVLKHAEARVGIQKDREQWATERAQWEAECREREKIRRAEREVELERQRRALEKEREEEEKKRADIRWGELERDPHCLRFGTRKYTAKLANIPDGYNKMKACKETGAWIHGRIVAPSSCEDKGLWIGVVGTWIVDFDEASCHTWWQEFKDKGCTDHGSGKRRIESHLENLPYGDDGNTMCSSTPAEFHGLRFNGPDSCVYWGKYGYWGIWFIDDNTCR